jgi:outer membrane protein assembly factor BamA
METMIEKVDINSLADIQDVVIDLSLPVEEKKKSYLRQIKNHRLYRYGDVVIRSTFAENGPSFEECLIQYLLSGQGLAL